MNGLRKFVEEHGDDIVGKTNHEAYAMYESGSYGDMAFRTFMIKLCTVFPYKTVQRCTRAGMVQTVERRETDRGMEAFLEERQAEDLHGEETEACYTKYAEACGRVGVMPMNRIAFSRKICAELGMRTKQAYRNGRYVPIFTDKEG